jgi:hypothetical protein
MSKANREAAMAAILADASLSAGARLLLVLAGDRVADDRILEAGCEHLAAETTGAAVGSVWRWRKELVERGYLIPMVETKGGAGISNEYRFVWQNPAEVRGSRPTKPRDNPAEVRGKTPRQPPTIARQQEQKRNRNPVEFSTNPSPERNDPIGCAHRALDDTGWCAACSTQVLEAS